MPVANLNDFDCHYLQLEQQGRSLELNSSENNLIMVHGLATNLAFWYHLAHAFTNTHRVTLFDLRGHGKSSMPKSNYTPKQLADDLKDLMDHLNIKTASLVGHSFGGTVLLHFLAEYPNYADRIILADVRSKLFQPLQMPCNWPRWSILQPALRAAGIDLDENEPEAGYRILTEIAKLQLRTPRGQHIPENQLLSSLFPLGNSTRTASQWLKLLETTTAWEDLIKSESLIIDQLQLVKLPTLAIYGENSSTLQTAHGLQKLWPHLHLEIVDEAGHFFPVSHPQKFITSVQKFLSLGTDKPSQT
ncbi:alpha/beta fold hydrolase [Anabaena sp. PCC 7108]|uniref:alpha/beta fold hydrolase n=1 Tax=Anabaena sp. PCC 7108 TaxID=163908 RepID=UPI00034DD2E6|nr:alpha/beta hydrolase [Anabaena sp. PCC 7108]